MLFAKLSLWRVNNLCRKNSIIHLSLGQHITWEIRLIIEHLYNIQKKNFTKIAAEVGKDRTTIGREIEKGLVQNLNSDLTIKHVYSATIAQRKHDINGSAKGPPLKIGNEHKLAKYIEELIGKNNSPEVIEDSIKKDDSYKTKICARTIYNYIDKKVLMITRNDLTYGNYRKKKREPKKENIIRLLNKQGRTIHDRPEEVEDRKTAGHWEMDTVEGIKGTDEPVLLVLSERATCQEIVCLIAGKTQYEVIKALNQMERKTGAKKFRKKFKTITTDNGGEFADYKGIEKSCINKSISRARQYYADAYCAWQRGTNENINKMIRRFLPKGKSLKDVTRSEVARIEYWINNYPRKKFGFRTSNEVYGSMTA